MQRALAVDDIIYSNTERRFNPRPEQYRNNNVRCPVQQQRDNRDIVPMELGHTATGR